MRKSNSRIDGCAIVSVSVCLYVFVVSPLIYFFSTPDAVGGPARFLHRFMDPHPENRIVWPVFAAISAILAVRHYDRIRNVAFPPHIVCLLTYVAFAGASVVWAFRPELSLMRFVLQLMILASIVLPAMLAARTTDVLHGLFLSFAVGAIINLLFVLLDNSPTLVKTLSGYPGYFGGKNYLGEFAAPAVLVSVHEMLYRGARRVFGLIIAIIATWLLVVSNSKTALGLVLLVPLVAASTLIGGKALRLSPALILFSVPVCYVVFSMVTGFSTNKLSYMIYGDSTFTGRTTIWDFANYEIGRRWFLGWGYQSFWLVGPDAPSFVEAPGWVKHMPNAHNGYLDTTLELGHVGLVLLLIFIAATLHVIGTVGKDQPGRAWILLSLALYVILHNFLESVWMRGFEFLWVMFAVVVGEAGRCWQLSRAERVARQSSGRRPGAFGSSRRSPCPRARVRA